MTYKDIVCGMDVNDTASFFTEYHGEKYYFCSDACQHKFLDEPGKYLSKQQPENEYCNDDRCDTGQHAYTCPMHPEITRNEPGNCPKCEMALEPMTAAATEENDEVDDMNRRFWISLFLSLPVFIVAMFSDLIPQYLPENISMHSIQWFEFVLATPVVLWGGWPFFVRGWPLPLS